MVLQENKNATFHDTKINFSFAFDPFGISGKECLCKILQEK